MNEILFLAKAVLLWLAFLWGRRFWDVLARPLPRGMIEVLAATPDRALAPLWARMTWGEIGRREWLIRLGFTPLSGIVYLSVMAFVVYQLGLRLFFSDLHVWFTSGEPPSWVFFFSDPLPLNLAVCWLVGALLTAVVRRPLLISILALAGIFTTVLSVSGGLMLILGERFAMFAFFYASFRRRAFPGDLSAILWSQLVGSILALFLSRWLSILLFSSMGWDGFSPAGRLLCLWVLLAGWCSLQTFLSLTILHFHYNRTRDEKVMEAFPPLWALRAGWFGGLRPVILIRAHQRLEALDRIHQEGKEDESLQRIPSPVLAKMEQERQELRGLLGSTQVP